MVKFIHPTMKTILFTRHDLSHLYIIKSIWFIFYLWSVRSLSWIFIFNNS